MQRSNSVCGRRSKTCLPCKKTNAKIGSSLQNSKNPRSTLLSCRCRQPSMAAPHFIFKWTEKLFGVGGSWTVSTNCSISSRRICPRSATDSPRLRVGAVVKWRVDYFAQKVWNTSNNNAWWAVRAQFWCSIALQPDEIVQEPGDIINELKQK